MNRWIKCDLPWTFYGDWKDMPEPPMLKKETKKEFGTTEEKEYKKLTDILGTAKFATKEYDKITKSKEYKAVKKAYKSLCAEISEWRKDHPEWIQYQIAIKSYSEHLEQKSFCGRKLNNPGTEVEILDNGVLKQYLIGDINMLGGVCDDCMGFSKDAVVVRYRILHER